MTDPTPNKIILEAAAKILNTSIGPLLCQRALSDEGLPAVHFTAYIINGPTMTVGPSWEDTEEGFAKRDSQFDLIDDAYAEEHYVPALLALITKLMPDAVA